MSVCIHTYIPSFCDQYVHLTPQTGLLNIILYMKEPENLEEMADSRASVNIANGHTSQVKWLPLAKIKIQINIDMTYYK